ARPAIGPPCEDSDSQTLMTARARSRLPYTQVQIAHQFRKSAVFAERVRARAEIPDDLEQALLHGGGPQCAGMGAAKQPLTREAQNGVVLGPGPAEVAMLRGLLEAIALPGHGAHPEPGQHDIHGEIGDALRAEQRLRFPRPGGTEGPVARPEIIAFTLEDFEQRRLELVIADF